MMGLRLADGIDRALFASVTGADPVTALGEAQARAAGRGGLTSRSMPRTSRQRPPAASASTRVLERLIA